MQGGGGGVSTSLCPQIGSPEIHSCASVFPLLHSRIVQSCSGPGGVCNISRYESHKTTLAKHKQQSRSEACTVQIGRIFVIRPSIRQTRVQDAGHTRTWTTLFPPVVADTGIQPNPNPNLVIKGRECMKSRSGSNAQDMSHMSAFYKATLSDYPLGYPHGFQSFNSFSKLASPITDLSPLKIVGKAWIPLAWHSAWLVGSAQSTKVAPLLARCAISLWQCGHQLAP